MLIHKIRHIDTCPYCGSHNVIDRITDAQCLNCGAIDKFIDVENTSNVQYDPSELDAIKDQVNDLEAMVAEPGRIPRQYNEKLQQLQGEVTYLRNKVDELQTKRKPKGQY